MMTENDRLKKIRLFLKKSQDDFASLLGMKQGSLSDIERGKDGISVSKEVKYRLDKDLNVSIDWLETGKGEMFKPNSQQNIAQNNKGVVVQGGIQGKGHHITNNAGGSDMLKSDTPTVKFYDPENAPSGKKLIPFYDDVVSIGGNNAMVASMGGVSHSSELIDPGDWFKDATAAIRNHGDSMIEYPCGCILALKQVYDMRLIVPGKDYVIETSEYRVTKKIRFTGNPEYIRAYSTNETKYDDGELIHQPFDIPLELVSKIYEILGYVVKTGGGTIVYSNKHK
jgi:DNA-binding XRE family transcriptional regulator